MKIIIFIYVLLIRTGTAWSIIILRFLSQKIYLFYFPTLGTLKADYANIRSCDTLFTIIYPLKSVLTPKQDEVYKNISNLDSIVVGERYSFLYDPLII